MKIGIDARLWSGAGLGRYIRNLILNLSRIDSKNEYILFVLKSDKENIEKKVGKNFKIVVSNIKPHTLREQYEFPKILKRENLDLVHFPYFSIPIFYNKPFVITIHDLIYHHFASGESSTLPYWLFGFKMFSYRVVINRAAINSKKIIAVSEFTKKDIVKMMHIDPDKIKVIYESADDFKNTNKKNSKYNNYFLYVGNIYPHKNSEKLVDAFLEFSKNNQTKLIFVGKTDTFYKKFNEKYKEEIRKEKILIIESASDEDLSLLYKNAIALVRPSLMEGFSLPPLESLQINTPVLVSDIPVHKEILGDSAIYFDLNDEMDLVSKLNYMLNLTTQEKSNLLKKRNQILDKLSWKNTARQTLEVYESCLSVRQSK